MRQQFSRHNQPVTCRCCGKLTTERVQGTYGLDMCAVCIDSAGVENEHQDGHHERGTRGDCPLCQLTYCMHYLKKASAPGTAT